MNLYDAWTARVTEAEARRELRRHGWESEIRADGALWADGEAVAQRGRDGLYLGADILGWLGY